MELQYVNIRDHRTKSNLQQTRILFEVGGLSTLLSSCVCCQFVNLRIIASILLLLPPPCYAGVVPTGFACAAVAELQAAENRRDGSDQRSLMEFTNE